MAYNLILTERADELLDHLARHLILRLNNPQAASHLFQSIENIYHLLAENPYLFKECCDPILKSKHYHEAPVSNMHYRIIYRIDKNTVYVLGIFHQLEDFQNKL